MRLTVNVVAAVLVVTFAWAQAPDNMEPAVQSSQQATPTPTVTTSPVVASSSHYPGLEPDELRGYARVTVQRVRKPRPLTDFEALEAQRYLDRHTKSMSEENRLSVAKALQLFLGLEIIHAPLKMDRDPDELIFAYQFFTEVLGDGVDWYVNVPIIETRGEKWPVFVPASGKLEDCIVSIALLAVDPGRTIFTQATVWCFEKIGALCEPDPATPPCITPQARQEAGAAQFGRVGDANTRYIGSAEVKKTKRHPAPEPCRPQPQPEEPGVCPGIDPPQDIPPGDTDDVGDPSGETPVECRPPVEIPGNQPGGSTGDYGLDNQPGGTPMEPIVADPVEPVSSGS